MWIALYLVPAIAVAIASWYVSKRFASFDPPSAAVRVLAAVAAGALWPLVLIGVAQLQLVRVIARRIRATSKASTPSAQTADVQTYH